MNNFVKNVEYLLHDRKFHPWGASLGVSKGSVDSMKKGVIPGGEILRNICRLENVNLNWLTSGKGTPFIVCKHTSAEEFEKSTQQHLEDSRDWKLSVISSISSENYILIWRMWAQTLYKTTPINYSEIIVEVGQWSTAHGTLLSHACDERLIELSTFHDTGMPYPSTSFIDVEQGKAGTYKLESWLGEMHPTATQLVLFPPRIKKIQQSNEGKKEIDTITLRDAINLVKNSQIDLDISDSQFSSAVSITYKKMSAGQKIDQKAIDMAIEMMQVNEK